MEKVKKEIVDKINTICKYVGELKQAKLLENIEYKYEDYVGLYYYTTRNSNLDYVGMAIVQFLLYIGNVRRIGWIKIGFLKDYFSMDFSDNRSVSSFITEYEVFKGNFDKRLPLLMELFIERDNQKKTSTMVMDFLELYRMIGREYLMCDKSEILQDDVERYIYYIDMMENKSKKKLKNQTNK